MPNLYKLSRILVVVACAFLLQPAGFAQEHKTIEVTPTNGNINSSVRKTAYRYKDFMDGKVTFNNGTYTLSKLNYNVLSGEMEFINSKNDTFALDNLFTISSIVIGDDSYAYDQEDKKLLTLVKANAKVRLFVKEKYEIKNIKSSGALGSERNSLPPTASREYFGKDRVYALDSTEKIQYSVKTSYYLNNLNSEFVLATERNTLKMFSDHKADLKAYFSQNKVDFNKAEDLEALVTFIVQIASR